MSLVFQRMGDERALLADDDKRAIWVLVPARMARLPGDSATREPRG